MILMSWVVLPEPLIGATLAQRGHSLQKPGRWGGFHMGLNPLGPCIQGKDSPDMQKVPRVRLSEWLMTPEKALIQQRPSCPPGAQC